MRHRLLIVLVLTMLGTTAVIRLSARGNVTAILNSKHDFRVNSGTEIRSVSGQNACIFCHTPHNANAGNGGATLWKRISGAQCPSVNNGQNVTGSITLQDRDGIILLRR